MKKEKVENSNTTSEKVKTEKVNSESAVKDNPFIRKNRAFDDMRDF